MVAANMTTPEAQSAAVRFDSFDLPEELLHALREVGYETPTPIQAEAIPCLLQGRDLLGHAPTGTGKTAAFALPLLAQLNMRDAAVQVMCLTPTRELAIQVAEAFARYAGPTAGGKDGRNDQRWSVQAGSAARACGHRARRGARRREQLQ